MPLRMTENINRVIVTLLFINRFQIYLVEAIRYGHAYKVITASNVCKYMKNEQHKSNSSLIRFCSRRANAYIL